MSPKTGIWNLAGWLLQLELDRHAVFDAAVDYEKLVSCKLSRDAGLGLERNSGDFLRETLVLLVQCSCSPFNWLLWGNDSSFWIVVGPYWNRPHDENAPHADGQHDYYVHSGLTSLCNFDPWEALALLFEVTNCSHCSIHRVDCRNSFWAWTFRSVRFWQWDRCSSDNFVKRSIAPAFLMLVGKIDPFFHPRLLSSQCRSCTRLEGFGSLCLPVALFVCSWPYWCSRQSGLCFPATPMILWCALWFSTPVCCVLSGA